MIHLINEKRIVPVVAINDSSKAADLASALVEGGLPIAEITLRTPASLDSIKIAANNKDLLVGVGSLRNAEDLKRAHDAGAKFAVSAGFSPSVAVEAARLGIPYFPGVSTPTEMLQAINEGITTLKFFPAETLGGVNALKAMAAPFPWDFLHANWWNKREQCNGLFSISLSRSRWRIMDGCIKAH